MKNNVLNGEEISPYRFLINNRRTNMRQDKNYPKIDEKLFSVIKTKGETGSVGNLLGFHPL